ncbi:helix-turn-helix domain-containing protein [Roseivirga thermotolerans]|uniref:HTH cro/C1-type domain-containing protein n=1 Tax=Roseivirga thermotolerans TaxID=1758176 RepID=A0ABQ3IDI2_9BACT|nr:helix-turn-helix transcriptional regulator [Roseivirga thermotolerans]GHE75981.1 hypothetical protein GCM10011340_36040 [Roseivirga thermotolerans]
MTFGQKLAFCRKEQRLSQTEIGKRSGVNGDIVGKYERDEMKPSIDTAKKLADALGVSLDYLIGSTNMVIDKKMLYRLEVLGSISKEERERILLVMDSLLRDAQMTDAHKKLAS